MKRTNSPGAGIPLSALSHAAQIDASPFARQPQKALPTKKALVFRTLSLLVVAGATMHVGSAAAGALPTDGLVALWQGEGNADDAVGTHDGTLVGDVKFAPGKVGQAFKLNGRDAYVNLGSAVDVPSWNDYAISLWFRHDGGGTGANGYGQKIIDKTVFFHDFYLTVYTVTGTPETGNLKFFTYEGGGDRMIDTAHDYRDKTWHQVVINKAGSSGEMWVDGELLATSTTVKTVSSDGPLVLGYSLSSDSFQRQYFSGRIDDVGIYDRPLMASEIARINMVPEPGTWLLFATGCVGLLGYGWRRRRWAA